MAVLTPVDVMVPTVELPPAMLLTSQVIAVPAAMHKDAENVCDAPTEMLAKGGVIAFGAAQEIVTLALADFDGSATLVAVTFTFGGAGASAGAVYVAESEPVAAIVPTVEFPPATLLTLQLTATLDMPAPVTIALKFADAPGATFAELGATLTTMPLWSCTLAEPLADSATWLVAVTVTVDGEGKVCGAVYRPEEEIVPLTKFPPVMPLTLQFTALELAPVTVAVNCCVCPSGTEAVAGCTVTVTFGGGFTEEEFASPQPDVMPTAALIAI